MRTLRWWLASAAIVAIGGYIGWIDAQPTGGFFKNVETGWASLLVIVVMIGAPTMFAAVALLARGHRVAGRAIQLGGSVAVAAVLAWDGYVSQIDCLDPGDVCELAGHSTAVGLLGGLGCVVAGLAVDVALSQRSHAQDA